MAGSAESTPKFTGSDLKDVNLTGDDVEAGGVLNQRGLSVGSLDKGEVFTLQDIDPALNAKMHLVNDVGHCPTRQEDLRRQEHN